MSEQTFDFKTLPAVLKTAGLSVAEAANIFRVSRPTVYSWGEGHAPTQKVILSNATRLISAIRKAVAAKELPVACDDPETKVSAVVKVLRKFLA